ncbi:MAG: branched-chain amino acid ABC transporter permease [Acidimicrobiia bacterium]
MWDSLKPFLVLGIALGGVFAMSGVGLVVLYRATGVLNLAYGAIGAVGALISWSLLDSGVSPWLAYPACVAFGGVLTLLYGLLFGPPLAAREPLVKTTATLGLMVILLGVMQRVWGRDPHGITLPTSHWNYQIGGVRVSWTQIIGVVFPIIVTAGTAVFLRVTRVGTAMRALANDREITAMLGVPVRRVEAAAWFGSGLLCGAAGLLLSNLVSLDIIGLTFLVVPALAAALIGQLHSLWITLGAGFLIGIVQSSLNSFSELAQFRSLTPFVLAIIALLSFAGRNELQART